ncbi:hypothetical protein AAW14_35925 [Streptomyces hygroscopicus]|uniref:hypothetical protein n=1 Tax=Streptomyces hygroscopicus TaxID=1912 RepID=UPI002240DC34|nr:hypothetical protein [Streptomyces hygroscopicus]MCW7947204.1 hypothetical protein [Streptomyces hygroscopicus]
MRGKPDVGAEGEAGTEARKKRLDLSVPQVAGSAVAAVVAAKLASYFGVYGTILGAGLVSTVATCGASVFQHVFRHTGEQIRGTGGGAAQSGRREHRAPAPGEFGEGTVYRAGARGRRRPVIAAALVFGVTMAGITSYELVPGNGFGGGSSTTVGDALTGHGKPSARSGTSPLPARMPSYGAGAPSDGASVANAPGGDTGSAPANGGTGTTGSPAPGATPATPGTGAGVSGVTPASPSASAMSPAPDAGSRSRTADPGQGGPSGR